MARIGIDPGGIKTEGIVMGQAGRIMLRGRQSTTQAGAIYDRWIHQELV
jgi:N-acetylglucosamine kinase-like BadF-type ATPase